MFSEVGRDALDLHELFEAGGNDPDARREVFYAVESLVERGLHDLNNYRQIFQREAAAKGE